MLDAPAGRQLRGDGAHPGAAAEAAGALAEAPTTPSATPPATALATATTTATAPAPAPRWLPAPLRAWWHDRGLAARLVMMTLGLLLLVQLAGFSVIHQGVQASAHRLLDERITFGTQVWQRLLDQRSATLHQGAALLAADYGFREAVASRDLATLRSALDNHRQRIGAAQAALLDTQLAVVATHDAGDAPLAAALRGLAPELVKRQGRSLVALVAGRPLQLVLVPMRAPVVVGWVAMGFPLDRALADDMHAVSGLHAGVLGQPQRGPARVLVSSLPAGLSAQPLAEQLADGDLQLGHETWLVRTVPVAAGAEGRVVLRLAGSVDAVVARFRTLQWTLALITLLGLALFGAGSHWLARRMTRPLRELAEASDALARGERDVPLAHLDRGDEIGELSRAFDHMRQSLAAQQQALRDLAFRDRLTQLPNRSALRDALQGDIGRSDPTRDGLAVVMLDLDRFKHVNDVLGYDFGDRVLCSVAERLPHLVRQGDLVARLGGDEFALLLRGAGMADAAALAQRLAVCFEQPLTLDDQTIDLSAGVGIALWPEHALDADGLLRRAEVAMYAAKRQTGGAQVYDPTVDTASAQTLSLLSELRRAVEHDELRLYLQPKIDIATGVVCGAEALVRWQHPERGLVPPLQFIPFAEQTGFIRQLTLWMVDQAAAAQAALARANVRRVSVNLSTRDLMDQELPDKLDEILRRHRAKAEGFCLEITESAIMDDPERAEATLNQLANRGYKLSIDDYGTGYSSLAYLRRLPVSELKIDKSFVMGMQRSSGDATIVRSTIDLAHNLGLTVVAEGVENEAILALLHDLRCDEGQGYHMSKPLPLPQFHDWAQRWQAVPPQLLAGADPAGALLH
ncbi:putative bifunctional diguanylate cyclase/phosphodiesterase [Aquabacterium sp. OR-4]|uniref:putative bifunctional diguanylate cyclase/phosphodiesterase n=1 Tax=Aquabacterium sp. OR-4 TaxID=2978127 RepID=UPI0028C5AF00|nr:EAL domain-containing protein [Aquabacterium sp. OR-4]MDT7833991.1 EAL domain-containing protein [Aquabacterium sp. OR-4]